MRAIERITNRMNDVGDLRWNQASVQNKTDAKEKETE